jgi:outer membrane protein TolC
MRRLFPHIVVVAALAATVSACTVGPNYKRPPVDVPPEFKEMPAAGQPTGAWKPAEPRDAALGGRWWQAFNDPQLDALEQQVAVSNQTIAQAEARFRAARAAVAGSRAPLYPTVTAGASTTRSRPSQNRSLSRQGLAPITTTDYQLPIDATYEVGPATPRRARARALRRALLARPDVASAISKVGRVERFRLWDDE